jgi:hypothetical protein
LVVGAICFFILQKAYPQGGFIRDLLAVTTIAVAGTILSFGSEKAAQRKYLRTLSIVVVVLLISVCYTKLYFKTALELSFSAIVLSVNKLDGDLSDTEKASRYWKNY